LPFASWTSTGLWEKGVRHLYIRVIASLGQPCTQTSHTMHRAGSKVSVLVSLFVEIASAGHRKAHTPQSVHLSSSKTMWPLLSWKGLRTLNGYILVAGPSSRFLNNITGI
jgi:hypothetical protein